MMYRRFTILFCILLCSVLSLRAQTSFTQKSVPSSTKEVTKDKILKVYPVPASTQITFSVKSPMSEDAYEIVIYNFLGKIMDKIGGFTNQKTLDLKDYYSGIYIYQLRDHQGHLKESGKFNVVKQ